jgi:hypothetical protein
VNSKDQDSYWIKAKIKADRNPQLLKTSVPLKSPLFGKLE